MNTYNLLDKYDTKIEVGFSIIYYSSLIKHNHINRQWLVTRITDRGSLICDTSKNWTEIPKKRCC